MTDTVAVALIAVSGTVGSGFLSYLAAGRATGVQLRGIDAEMQRLQETHAEEHRRERRTAYYEFIAMDQLKQLSYGLLGEVTLDRFREFNSNLADAYTNVYFLGEERVLDPAEKMTELLAKLNGLMIEADQEVPFHQRLQDAINNLAEDWQSAEARLVDAMRSDIRNARQAEAVARSRA